MTELLRVGEIDADERIVAAVAFDPDDIDAAFEELDARYLAGEAAAHAHTWSAIAQAYAAVTGTSYRRRRRTGSTSTTGEAAHSHRVSWRRTFTPPGSSCRTSTSTSRRCIG